MMSTHLGEYAKSSIDGVNDVVYIGVIQHVQCVVEPRKAHVLNLSNWLHVLLCFYLVKTI